MRYTVRMSETRYGEVEVEAENEEQAKTIASGKEIDWYDSDPADMDVVLTSDELPEDDEDYIHRQLPTLEILCQLAEEAAELSQAALKLRRALDGSNPTTVSARTAMNNLVEETADVRLCESLLLSPQDTRRAKEIMAQKKKRWVSRLRMAEKEREEDAQIPAELC